jgi:heme A synthase
VSSGRRYLTGFILVAVIGAGMIAWVPHELRDEVGWGLLIGLLVQAPLGWWTIRSIGKRRFLGVWAGGMLVRLLVLAISGFLLVPAFGWEIAPALGALLMTLVALLVLEVVIAMREQSGMARR